MYDRQLKQSLTATTPTFFLMYNTLELFFDNFLNAIFKNFHCALVTREDWRIFEIASSQELKCDSHTVIKKRVLRTLRKFRTSQNLSKGNKAK